MSRKIENLAAETLEAILKAAKGSNFWGKRLDDSRLNCAEGIAGALDLAGKVEIRDLVEWLDGNKPAPVNKAKLTRSTNKAAADTMIGGSSAPSTASLPIHDSSRAYIVTSAQNNTAVHAGAWAALQDVAETVGAEIIVLPFWYNKNAFSPAKDEGSREYFASEIRDYMLGEHDDCFLWSRRAVKLMPSAAILPTAKLPVNAAKQLNTGEGLTLVGSPKQQLEMLPELGNIIRAGLATGTVTQMNYTRSRAGSEAETDHTFGGLLVWVDGDGVNLTQLQYRDDRIEFYAHGLGNNMDEWDAAPAMKLGDLHCEMFDPDCWVKTCDLVQEIQPCFVAVEDVLHFSSRSHHNRGSGKHLYCSQGETVLGELHQVVSQLNELAALVPTLYVTESNHNSALDNWLDDAKYSPKTDPVNAKVYHLLNWALCEAIDQEHESAISALRVALDAPFLDRESLGLPPLAASIEFGRGDVSEVVYGCEMSQHGHKGQNGSFGSPKLFAKWGTCLATGHTHSPAQIGRVIVAGVTARKDQGYNRLGASSWAQADSIIYSNGAQAHIFKETFPL